MRILDNVNKTLLFAREALLPYGNQRQRWASLRLLHQMWHLLLRLAPLEHNEGKRPFTRREQRRQARATLTALRQALPHLRALLQADIVATREIDPAAKDETVIALCYPGIEALLAHRIAHILYTNGTPLLARMLTEAAHSKTGIDIHPGAKIGAGCAIDHGTGIVIGETAVLGEGVTIYHGVTLGAKNPKEERGKKRHPTIGDHVTLYAYASILGGDTVISEGASIPSGARITHSI